MAEKKPAKATAKRTAKAASASSATSKRTAAGKTATKQPAPKPATTKKVATKKTSTKRTSTTKTSTKQVATKKAAAKQTTAKPATAVRKATDEQRMPEQLAERASALAVREDESPWSPDELSEVLAELQADADRLRGEIVDVENELDDMLRNSGEGAGDDQADAGSKTFEREHEMSLMANAREMLAQTERAIDRIKAGTYGNCEGCDRAIGKERLRAYPRATLCVSCKQREERR